MMKFIAALPFLFVFMLQECCAAKSSTASTGELNTAFIDRNYCLQEFTDPSVFAQIMINIIIDF